MIKFYGRKEWVPKKCPKCDARLGFLTYRIVLDIDPFWRMKRWGAWCNVCAIRKNLDTPKEETMFYKLMKLREKSGNTIPLNFKCV
jgi:hypothetical protein